jgi:hypothetical protein
MRITLLLLFGWFYISADLYAQKVEALNGIITIDTALNFTRLSGSQIFDTTKSWLSENTAPSYKDMLKKEEPSKMIKLLRLANYWAALGTRQTYSHDLIFTIDDTRLTITLINFRTYSHNQNVNPIEQSMTSGMSADEFFIDKNGKLKKKWSKFYTDVERDFKEFVSDFTTTLKK